MKRVRDNIRTYRCKAHLRFLFIAGRKCSRTVSPFAWFCLLLSGARICTVATQCLYTHQKQKLAFKFNSLLVACGISVPLNNLLRNWIKKAPSHFSTVSRNISSSLPAIFAAYRHFSSQEKLKLTANNQSILYFKRSEEEKLLFPLSSKITFIIIGESAFLYHYLF